MNSPVTVGVVGATGRIGSIIVSGLHSAENCEFQITALIRPMSMEKTSVARLAERGIKIKPADSKAPPDELANTLSGIDVLICVLPPDSTMDQIPFADAALKAGVKRFVPNMWATSSPPTGVMKIRDWHEVMIPRINSGRLDHVALYSTYFFVNDGSAPCATCYIDDVGRYVARIVSDSRTINRKVFAYGEVTTQADVVQFIERLTGEAVPRMEVSSEQVERAVRSAELDLWPQVILEYAFSAWARRDNQPERAAFLGYVDAKNLYPDFEPIPLATTIQDALAHGGINIEFGNPEKCEQIASVLRKWK